MSRNEALREEYKAHAMGARYVKKQNSEAKKYYKKNRL